MTLGDPLASILTGANRLRLTCTTCAHETFFSRDGAIQRFGPDALPRDVMNRSRCSACGSKETRAVIVSA